jgi:glutaredoxin
MSWTWLRSWLSSAKRTDWDVIMYTRPGCHLCEQAWERLERARQRHGFALRQVDIASDPQLDQEYSACVPVVTINGRVRFRGIVNPVLLERLLSAGG